MLNIRICVYTFYTKLVRSLSLSLFSISSNDRYTHPFQRTACLAKQNGEASSKLQYSYATEKWGREIKFYGFFAWFHLIYYFMSCSNRIVSYRIVSLYLWQTDDYAWHWITQYRARTVWTSFVARWQYKLVLLRFGLFMKLFYTFVEARMWKFFMHNCLCIFICKVVQTKQRKTMRMTKRSTQLAINCILYNLNSFLNISTPFHVWALGLL